jgi:tRNA-uridine 2-sulfurtransferase
MAKAVVLMSTGLDSLLSAVIVRDQGVEVEALHCAFEFGFTPGPDRKDVIKSLIDPLGIPLHVLDVTERFMKILRAPEHGFGSGVNPCIDCHLFMLRLAKARMLETGADFVVTGDVVGQRPMSQNRPMLFHIEKHAELKGLILRPLSAKALPVTVPEEKGWVDREKLFGITGRGRKTQEELASRFAIARYFQPAGGCILTDPFYAKRVKAFISRRGQEALDPGVMMLCRFGRHFWLGDGRWVIVGREEKDNDSLEKLAGGKWIFEAVDVEGPTGLADGPWDESQARFMASILVRYVNKKGDGEIRVRFRRGDEEHELSVTAADASAVDTFRI